jgi:hypothetical protein
VHRRLGLWPEDRAEFPEPVAAPVDVQHLHMVQEPVEDGRRKELIIRKDDWPIPHVLVRGQHDAPPLVARRDEPEDEVGLGPVQRSEAHLVDDQQPRVEVPLRLEPGGRHRGIGRSACLRSSSTKWVTEKPFLIALTPSAAAKWLFPTPGGPRKRTFVFSRMKLQVASVSICRRSTRGRKVQSKSSRVFPGGKDESLSIVVARRSSFRSSSPAQHELEEAERRELLAGGLLDELRETARGGLESQGGELGGDRVERDELQECAAPQRRRRAHRRGRSTIRVRGDQDKPGQAPNRIPQRGHRRWPDSMGGGRSPWITASSAG